MFRRRNKPAVQETIAETTNHEGRLIRKADPLAVLPHLFHELGIQSNLLVSATYIHPTIHLMPSLVYHSLASVISQHPALSIIGVTRPSTKTPGHHRIWDAHLPIIQLKDCVEFLDLDFDGDGQLAQTLEETHNFWFSTSDKTKPLWKILVLNGKTVVWVCHHGIADGLSGYAFHRSFLEALNSPHVVAKEDDIESVITPRIDAAALPSPLEDFEENLSWLHVIKTFLFWVLLRFFVPSQYFLFSDAVVSPRFPTVSNPFPASEKTITKVAILRIDSEVMQKCLEACRLHQTSFTALLHTLIQITLAVDEYPNARLGFSRLAVSVRNLLKNDRRIGKDVITDAVSVYYGFHFLSSYRDAGTLPMIHKSKIPLQKGKAWKLAKKYKDDLNAAMYTKKSVAQEFLSAKLLGEDNEDFGKFFGLGLYQNNSFLISNLGVFEPKGNSGGSEDGGNSGESANRAKSAESGIGGGGWKVSDVAFSAGAIRANLGDFGIVFNVASVKGGDCVVCACWEEGVLKEEMVKRVLRSVGAKIKLMVR
ncbi:uncharacterized protein LY89DRAFT_780265 [Mollisia scopiformis]|uniref:Alcohol acetyltransferase n=1 Tax=Mollisia scopiformis TaxID=149040 RepID=A0A194XGM3_MOLSC|nr:uncharacterized protein LY89DRAFT_780265 [Mollisia scopiformis]KUJ19284.1 hypothetical protein LY89DRAFT_780265 [Mollisia scopiformis]